VLAPFTVFLWLATSVAMTISGPFGTYARLAYPVRALHWLLIVGAAIVVGTGLRVAMRLYRPEMSLIMRGMVMSILMTAIYTPMLIGIIRLTGGNDFPFLPAFLQFGSYVFTVAISIALAQVVYALQFGQSEPRLIERLPEGGRWRNVVRLASRDHYVEVVTDEGVTSLLMRFSDALAELEGVDGLQVHRSHWVARRAVTGMEREKGRTFLITSDGARVPVSRGYMEAVRAAGLLERKVA